MSIYGGFPTRQLQSNYNDNLYQLIALLQQQLIRQTAPLDPNFQQNFDRLHKKLGFLEQHKHLQPKFAGACQPLRLHLQGDTSRKSLCNNTEQVRPRLLSSQQPRRNSSEWNTQLSSTIKQEPLKKPALKEAKRPVIYISGQPRKIGERERMLSAGLRGTSLNMFNGRFSKEEYLSKLVNQPRRKKSLKVMKRRLAQRLSRDGL